MVVMSVVLLVRAMEGLHAVAVAHFLGTSGIVVREGISCGVVAWLVVLVLGVTVVVCFGWGSHGGSCHRGYRRGQGTLLVLVLVLVFRDG